VERAIARAMNEEPGLYAPLSPVCLPGYPLCATRKLYFEARDGPVRREIGVGQVILNRVRSLQFPQTICGVVYQDQMSPNCQFPFACDGRSDKPQEDAQWALAQDLAREITAGQVWLPELGYSTPEAIRQTDREGIG
jgi:spore germination cell wall hydrolase CwlJ-like protein